jgi:tRNA(fMet)-specific endonuclease VapC
MTGSRLLDTNALIALSAEDTAIQHHLSGMDLFVPSIALGELYFGAYKSSQAEANLAKLRVFVANKVVLPCDSETAQQYGQIKQFLRVKGRPIPENDIWIAAIALQHKLTLLTRDQHFAEVSSLQTESW